MLSPGSDVTYTQYGKKDVVKTPPSSERGKKHQTHPKNPPTSPSQSHSALFFLNVSFSLWMAGADRNFQGTCEPSRPSPLFERMYCCRPWPFNTIQSMLVSTNSATLHSTGGTTDMVLKRSLHWVTWRNSCSGGLYVFQRQHFSFTKAILSAKYHAQMVDWWARQKKAPHHVSVTPLGDSVSLDN